MSSVSLVKADNPAAYPKAIERSLSLIGFHFSPDLRKIAIKPNMSLFMDYSTGQTTDPRIVAAFIDIARKHASPKLDISVVESDTEARQFHHVSTFLGYKKLCETKHVTLVNLSEDSNQETEVTVANRPLRLLLPDTIRNADLFVNIPKLKLHPRTQLSCALKNVYGCNPSQSKSSHHSHLTEAIVGLTKLMRPNLSIVDGVLVQGKGTRQLGLIMAGADPVATDAAAAVIVGTTPSKVKTITLAAKEGVGSMSYKLAGESLEYFAKLFPKRSAVDKIRTRVNNAILALTKRTSPRA